MTEKKKQGFDFTPDLGLPNENISRKTSVNFNEAVAAYLERKRMQDSVNISAYVNKVMTERYEAEKALTDDIYGTLPQEVVKVELMMHKDVAVFLNLLVLRKGAIPLASKLAELIQQDTGGIMQGDCNIYGSNNRLNEILAAYIRASERLKNNPV